MRIIPLLKNLVKILNVNRVIPLYKSSVKNTLPHIYLFNIPARETKDFCLACINTNHTHNDYNDQNDCDFYVLQP